nr:putative polyprotein [Tanacetum cinerariifolium]
MKVIIIEASIRRDLRFEDEAGVDCLSNDVIFEQLILIGSTMASAIICLATNKKFNFSKYIFDNMVKHLDGGVKFLMYPRFVQVFLDNQVEGMDRHNAIFVISSHTKKVFANMKREGNDFSRKVTPLFQSMMVQDLEDMGEGLELPTDLHHTPILTQLSSSPHQKKKKSRRKQRKEIKVPSPSSEIPNEEESRNENKKRKSRTSRLKRLRKVGSARRVESSTEASLGDQEDASKQGRMIDNIDQDVEIALVDDTQGRINEEYMLKVNDLDGDKVVVYVSTITTTGIEVTTSTTTPQISKDELTLAQTLIEIKAAKSKAITTAATTVTDVGTRHKEKGIVCLQLDTLVIQSSLYTESHYRFVIEIRAFIKCNVISFFSLLSFSVDDSECLGDKAEDLVDILKDTRSAFFTHDSPTDEPIIILDVSEEEENVENDKDTKDTSSQKKKLEQVKVIVEPEVASIKAKPLYPNINQLTELLVTSLKPELSKLLSSHDFASLLPTELKELPSKIIGLSREIKELKQHIKDMEIELPGDLKEIPSKLENFTPTITNLLSYVAELKNIQLKLPAEFLDLPHLASSVQEKLKTLDSLPGATTMGVPSADKAIASPAKGEKDADINLKNELVDLLGIDIVTSDEIWYTVFQYPISVKVFMDDFFIFGSSFCHRLNNFDKMLQHCKDAHLVLNWEECHFKVKEGIVLGHKVSEAGPEVDKENINVMSASLQ